MTLSTTLWLQGVIFFFSALFLAVGYTSAVKKMVRRWTSIAMVATFSLAVLSGLAGIWTAFVGL